MTLIFHPHEITHPYALSDDGRCTRYPYITSDKLEDQNYQLGCI